MTTQFNYGPAERATIRVLPFAGESKLNGGSVDGMSLSDITRQGLRLVEARSGIPVHVAPDPSLPGTTLVRVVMARGKVALHRASYRPDRSSPPDYLISRQDAVYYCLEAMKRYAQMSPGDFQKLTLELAMVGRDGFEVHNPASRYHVKGLDGEYSGLAMVCFLYVAMQRMAPGTNIGFDLAAE